MNNMETAARPFVEPMLLGRRSLTLGADALHKVVAWITLKMMVYEWDVPHEAAFSREDTLKFADDRQIPDGVSVWVFKASESEMRAYASRAFANISQTLGVLTKKANVNATVFVVGRLVVYFLFTRANALEFNEPSQFRAKRLWPARGSRVVWPPHRTIDEAGVAELAMALRRFVEARGVLV
jgi:hypothetical protein